MDEVEELMGTGVFQEAKHVDVEEEIMAIKGRSGGGGRGRGINGGNGWREGEMGEFREGSLLMERYDIIINK